MVRLSRALLVLSCVAVALGCSRLRRSVGLGESPAPSASASLQVSSAPAAPSSSAAKLPAGDAADDESEATPPSGFVRMTVRGVAPTAQGNAVLLVDENQKRGVPIFVGETEALSIRLRLANRRYARPLTHDLFDSALDQLGAKVEYVRVDKLQNNVFFGTVVLTSGKKYIELDARSSDAVALALGRDVPIFMARPVLDRSAIDLDKIPMEKPGSPENLEIDPRKPDPIAL
jgi:bifunctional DNase/RNase